MLSFFSKTFLKENLSKCQCKNLANSDLEDRFSQDSGLEVDDNDLEFIVFFFNKIKNSQNGLYSQLDMISNLNFETQFFIFRDCV